MKILSWQFCWGVDFLKLINVSNKTPEPSSPEQVAVDVNSRAGKLTGHEIVSLLFTITN